MRSFTLFLLPLFLMLLGEHALAAEKDNAYAYTVKANGGEEVSLAQYNGKVTLMVNTASNCGYTPQYADLQEIYQKYEKEGFSVLAFPSNDFGGQEPGSNQEIKNFCEATYEVTFPLFEKGAVKGSEKQELFTYLTSTAPEAGEIKWNFEKFLVDKDGKVVKRFRSSVRPNSDELVAEIEKLIEAKG